MTGWQIAELLDLNSTGEYRTLRLVNSHDVALDFTVWLTLGVGRNRAWYFHMSREVTCRIVDSDGNDTGTRLKDIRHWRGRANKPSNTYKEVR